MRFTLSFITLFALAVVVQACPPSFQQVQVQQSTACYSAPIQQLQAYVAPVQSYAVQSYAVPVRQFAVQSYVAPVRVQKVIVRQKAFAAQSYGVQSLSSPTIIQQSTIQRKGLFGLRKNVQQSTTIINP